MKGLLLKDLYMAKTYCKAYLLIAIVFTLASLGSENNFFFVFYPCMLCGMIPVNLLGYDERSRWMQYSNTLPYTRGQIVSGKYIIGMMAQLAMLIVTGIAQAIKMTMNHTFHLTSLVILMLAILVTATLTFSVTLPFIFKYGIEKGRIAYFVMIGFVCAIGYLTTAVSPSNPIITIDSDILFLILMIAGIVIYALSWYLSILFYKKREL